MRATTGRVAVVILLLIGICGCTSSPTWSSLAWWRKKPDTAVATTDAPKFNPANPALPSAAQNPNNSLASAVRPGTANPAASAPFASNPAGPVGMSGYGATPASYQNSVYPTTPYQSVTVNTAAGGSATNSWSNSPSNAWNTGVQNPGPAVGYGAATSAMPGRYAPGVAAASPPTAGATASGAMPQGYASGNPSTAMASVPAYASGASAATFPGYGGAAAAPTGSVQPQAGFYNPTYDGGAAATRYASGAAIPGAAPSASMGASALPPSNSIPNYRTADVRNSMTTGIAPPANAAAAAPSANSSMVGDRYSGTMSAAISPAAASPAATSAAPNADRYAFPAAAPAAAVPASMAPYTGGTPGISDRYSQPAGGNQPAGGGQPAASPYDPRGAGYQPGAAGSPMGNTGYPTGSTSTSSTLGNAAMSALPARSTTEYRPGGTSNYISPSGNPVQPGSSGALPDAHSQYGVTQASYQVPETTAGRTMPGVALASATSAAPSNGEVYGAYQGGGSQGNSSASEPAYGAPNPTAPPALLPAHSGW